MYLQLNAFTQEVPPFSITASACSPQPTPSMVLVLLLYIILLPVFFPPVCSPKGRKDNQLLFSFSLSETGSHV